MDGRPLASPRGGIRRYVECLTMALARVAPQHEFVLCGLSRPVAARLDPRLRATPERFSGARWLDHVRLVSVRGPFDLIAGKGGFAGLDGLAGVGEGGVLEQGVLG